METGACANACLFDENWNLTDVVLGVRSCGTEVIVKGRSRNKSLPEPEAVKPCRLPFRAVPIFRVFTPMINAYDGFSKVNI